MAYNQLDQYHRAFRTYKSELARSGQETGLHRAICHAAVSEEHLEAVRFRCTVHTDWIEAIEQGLPYIERAILENRQFILQQGEVQSIEKAKKVSKASVEHLAKHSELITHLPKTGEDLMPDKIYVVENDSNFAVYENRFLYMLLLTLSDFVDTKYAKIVTFWNKYESRLEISKQVTLGKRKLDFSLSLKEESQNDLDTAYDEECCAYLTRINELQRTISMLLNHPLMKEVSHAALIKPPITRTNVLKMDPNFKMAVELYDFLSAYESDGYTLQEIGECFDRFPELMESDFAELITVSSYLSYRYGGKLEPLMEQRYELKNKQLRMEEDRAIREALHALKERLKSGKTSVEEYVRTLEERNVSLEQDRDRINAVEAEISEVRQALYLSNESNDALHGVNDALKGELLEKDRLAAEEERRHRAELAAQKDSYEQMLEELRRRQEETMERCRQAMAQLHGIRQQYALIPDDEDYSSKEMLVELEMERKAFDKLFDAQWKKAKKQIRKNVLGSKKQAGEASSDKNND